MTPERAKELLPIIQAYAEGRTIQYMKHEKWDDLAPHVSFNSTGKYRIKPEKKIGWINIYGRGVGSVFHQSKQHADEYQLHNRLACIKIEYEEGEGL